MTGDENLALGVSFGRLLKSQIERQAMDSGVIFDESKIKEGFLVGLGDTEHQFSNEQLDLLLTEIDRKVRDGVLALASKEKAANIQSGKRRIAKLENEPDAIRLESGVVYINLSPPTENRRPVSANDTVAIKYKMETAAGIVLDDTYDAELGVEFVIDGLLFGIQQVIVNAEIGGRYLAIIPPELAYGDESQLVDPGTYIVFEFDLLEIK
ncbi:FKBP-type peptidyl-prolyl cis-trans isomerase [Vibrio agarivorans]|uniref:Peptidyl-prolyl cis-trans isomerase n=1 Tax=Vibrio agarivorans TaxID=153622 RepID=A0ABT7Y7H9_9VIBR|nr:FKBP-type peptidyl-prolyl cis-trans isomerase [Vibrio agarivorans]MDN2483905.1 FKBP-type peptidyl-prolyl cis-trans isomerase [Vibrio agarivorans]